MVVETLRLPKNGVLHNFLHHREWDYQIMRMTKKSPPGSVKETNWQGQKYGNFTVLKQ